MFEPAEIAASMPQQLRPFSIPDPGGQVTRSWDILKRAHESAASLLASFSEERDPGAPSDTEQDLLRAMIVFAAAGLDAMLKQLLSDCLNTALEKSEGAAEKLAEYPGAAFATMTPRSRSRANENAASS